MTRIRAGSLRSGRVPISNLRCTCCDNIFPIPRIFAKEKNHIKDLWCPNCKQITKHLENECQKEQADPFVNSNYDKPEEVDIDYWLQVFSVNEREKEGERTQHEKTDKYGSVCTVSSGNYLKRCARS